MLVNFKPTDFSISKALQANGADLGLQHKKGIGWLTWESNLQAWFPTAGTNHLGHWGMKFRDAGADSIANKLESTSSAQSILKQLLDIPEFTEAKWNKDPDKVGLGNGYFNVRKLEFGKQKPSDYISINIPTMYNDEAKCPKFDKFMVDIQPNEETRKYLQKLLGTGMLPRTPDQTFHFWFGEGSNGKGILGNVISAVIGPMSGTIASNVFMRKGDESATRFALSRIQECRLLFASEVDKGSSLSESMIKQLTGEEPTVVEEKGKTQESVILRATLHMRVNEIPKISDSSYAMSRRFRVVPFQQQFDPQQNQHLQAELELEKEGILLWLLEGAHLYLTEGLGYPDTIRNATSHALKESFEYSDFIQECLIASPKDREELKDIKVEYVDWAKANGQNPHVTSQKMAEALRNFFPDLQILHPKNVTTYVGIRLLSSTTKGMEIE